MVEGACLENRCTFARTGGSNPFLTANYEVGQLVAKATGCFWILAAAKLAWMTAEAGNSQLALQGRQLSNFVFARAPRRAVRDAASGGIPGEEGMTSSLLPI